MASFSLHTFSTISLSRSFVSLTSPQSATEATHFVSESDIFLILRVREKHLLLEGTYFAPACVASAAHVAGEFCPAHCLSGELGSCRSLAHLSQHSACYWYGCKSQWFAKSAPWYVGKDPWSERNLAWVTKQRIISCTSCNIVVMFGKTLMLDASVILNDWSKNLIMWTFGWR